MDEPDIVTRLRESDGGYFMRKMFTEAADEIERLRNERNAFEAERDQLISISNKLKRERDEARRIACKMEERLGCDDSGCPKNGLAHDHAKRRGWDCFKENTND